MQEFVLMNVIHMVDDILVSAIFKQVPFNYVNSSQSSRILCGNYRKSDSGVLLRLDLGATSSLTIHCHPSLHSKGIQI